MTRSLALDAQHAPSTTRARSCATLALTAPHAPAISRTLSCTPLALLAFVASQFVLSARADAQDDATRAETMRVERAPDPLSYAVPAATRAGTMTYGDASVQTADPHRVEVTPGLEVFGRYALTVRDTSDGSTWDHLFDVPRVHAAISARYEGATARVVLEGVRSTAAGALVGVATDSVLLRLREAYAGYKFFYDAVELQLGIVPSLTIPALESAWGLRPVNATPLEETNLAAAADLGARATLRLPSRLGWVGVVASNGEGYTSRELNRGKNTELAAELHPLAPFVPALAPLAVFVSGVYGSQGVASTRAHRLTAGLLWRGDFRHGLRSSTAQTGAAQAGAAQTGAAQTGTTQGTAQTSAAQGSTAQGGTAQNSAAQTSAPFSAGALVTLAWGVDDVPEREAMLLELFARAELFERLLLGVRFVHFLRDRSVSNDRLTTIVATVGYRLAAPLELFLALNRGLPTSAAEAALPGSNLWDVAVTTRVAF